MQCAIWDDGDYRNLTIEAQWLYEAILMQKDLSLCGVLTWTPKRFAKLATNASVEMVYKALDLLRTERYVVLDESTDELLVRTLIKNDRVLDNPNSIIGMTNAFGAIHSKVIRDAVVDGLGDGFMDGLPHRFPKGLPKGFHDRLGKPFRDALALAGGRASPCAPVPPASCLLPPSSPGQRSDNGDHADKDRAAPVVVEEDPKSRRAGPSGTEGVLAEAAAILASQDLERHLADGHDVRNRSAWLRTAAENRRAGVDEYRGMVDEGKIRSVRDLVVRLGGDDPDDPTGSKKAEAAWQETLRRRAEAEAVEVIRCPPEILAALRNGSGEKP